MIMFGYISTYNYGLGQMLHEWFNIPFHQTKIPHDLWSLMQISVGGYIVGRSGVQALGAYGNLKKD